MKHSSGLALSLAICTALLAACGSKPVAKAPVEDRGSARAAAGRAPSTPVAATPAPPADAGKPLRGLENAGKPGFYTVQRGDTLVRIALDHGQNWRDIARWNNIDNPNLIEVGEVFRVQAPGSEGVVAKPVTTGAATATPLPTPTKLPPAASTPPAPAPAPATAQSPSMAPAGEDDLAWIWPARGSTVAGFDEAKNKGLDIAGKAGDPVFAAADGRVVYAGSGLRGYGNLVIIKHNNTYLTAYAHNQSLLVKEDQVVKQGQKIAEMGSTDADRVKLHFEIRRQGKPVDPARYLPGR